MRKKLEIFGEYVAHLTLGLAMFAALLLFGGAVNKLVHWTAPLIGDNSFTDLMKLVEQTILYADVAFIVWWSVYSTYKAIREGMKDE
jgi:ABC-type uncharacterized transport system permease subunit